MSTFYAPGLPAEGVSYRRRSYREAVKAGREHYPEDFHADPEDDFGADLAAKSVAYSKAYLRKLSAVNNYTCAGAEVTSALASEQQTSLRGMAAILHHSYWRVSRLRADLTGSANGLAITSGGCSFIAARYRALMTCTAAVVIRPVGSTRST